VVAFLISDKINKSVEEKEVGKKTESLKEKNLNKQSTDAFIPQELLFQREQLQLSTHKLLQLHKK
jgi:hypothetical protein